MQVIAVTKKPGAEGFLQGGGGKVLLHDQPSLGRFYFCDARFGWVAPVVKKTVAFDPADAGLLGAHGVLAWSCDSTGGEWQRRLDPTVSSHAISPDAPPSL